MHNAGRTLTLGSKSFNTATGGTITTNGDWKIHEFTTVGTFTLTSLAGSPADRTLYYLVTGGGSGGQSAGNYQGGGGGGVRTGTIPSPTPTYSISAIGGGGAVSTTSHPPGGTTTFAGLSSSGGQIPGASGSQPGPPFAAAAPITITYFLGGGGGGAGGAGTRGYSDSFVRYTGSGGGAVGLNAPDGTPLAVGGAGGGGGTSSRGGPSIWIFHTFWTTMQYGYGGGGDAFRNSSSSPQVGLPAFPASAGNPGAVYVAYKYK
jgi:hypothetical protein